MIFSASSLFPFVKSKIWRPLRSYQNLPNSPSLAKLVIDLVSAASFCGVLTPSGAPTYLPVVPTLFLPPMSEVMSGLNDSTPAAASNSSNIEAADPVNGSSPAGASILLMAGEPIALAPPMPPATPANNSAAVDSGATSRAIDAADSPPTYAPLSRPRLGNMVSNCLAAVGADTAVRPAAANGRICVAILPIA